jgi:predicted RNA-binding Zn ribbon-like protein
VSETRTPEETHRAPPSTEGEPAPGELELVRSFVNTRELDPDREELTDPAVLEAWLRDHGVASGSALGSHDLERAIAFREALRGLLLANGGSALERSAIEALQSAAEAVSLRPEVGADGSVGLAPAADGLAALVARVFAAIAGAQENGTWERLKACSSEECLWAFYDRSRNHSRHWCSMAVCGNRAKTRAYRAKHR